MLKAKNQKQKTKILRDDHTPTINRHEAHLF